MKNHIQNFGKNINARETKTIYYLILFLSTFAVSTISATYVLFLLSQGLDLLQVNLVNVAFMVGIFIFEIPTGAYADNFGRRKSVIISTILIIVAFTTYFLSSTLWMFILAETIAAIAWTFRSGALDAWLVDSLKKNNFQGEVDKIFSHAAIIGQSASLLGGLIGAYIGVVSLRLPLGFAVIVSLLTLAIVYFFMREGKTLKFPINFISGLNQMKKMSKEGIIYGVKHKVILWLIFANVLALFAFQPLNMYWSPRLNVLAGDQIWIMGWVWVGISLAMMGVAFVVRHLFNKAVSYASSLVIMSLVLSVPIFFGATSEIFAVVLSSFLIYEVGRGMMGPIQSSYLNKHIESSHRATVLSFHSMIGRVGAVGGLIILGWVGKNHSIQFSWAIAGILLLLLVPIFLRVAYHEKKLVETSSKDTELILR